jgi:hypothetical protein
MRCRGEWSPRGGSRARSSSTSDATTRARPERGLICGCRSCLFSVGQLLTPAPPAPDLPCSGTPRPPASPKESRPALLRGARVRAGPTSRRNSHYVGWKGRDNGARS